MKSLVQLAALFGVVSTLVAGDVPTCQANIQQTAECSALCASYASDPTKCLGHFGLGHCVVANNPQCHPQWPFPYPEPSEIARCQAAVTSDPSCQEYCLQFAMVPWSTTCVAGQLLTECTLEAIKSTDCAIAPAGGVPPAMSAQAAHVPMVGGGKIAAAVQQIAAVRGRYIEISPSGNPVFTQSGALLRVFPISPVGYRLGKLNAGLRGAAPKAIPAFPKAIPDFRMPLAPKAIPAFPNQISALPKAIPKAIPVFPMAPAPKAMPAFPNQLSALPKAIPKAIPVFPMAPAPKAMQAFPKAIPAFPNQLSALPKAIPKAIPVFPMAPAPKAIPAFPKAMPAFPNQLSALPKAIPKAIPVF